MTDPAFEGTLEFDVDLTVFGKQKTVRCRIEYGFTPAWQFFCTRDHRLKIRLESSSYGISYLREPFPEETEYRDGVFAKVKTEWIEDEAGFLFDFLPADIQYRINDEIEKRSWNKDQENRKSHGMPPGDPEKAFADRTDDFMKAA